MNELEKLYADAAAAMNRAQWQPARELSARLLQARPGDANVHFIAGVAASRLRQSGPAIDHLRRATALDPSRAEHWLELARAFLDGWLVREAVAAADKAYALGSAEAMVWARLGTIYGRAHVQEKSAAAFARAVELAPGSAGYRFNLVVALMAVGDLEGAERQCLECLRLNPGFWRAWLMLAQLCRPTPQDNHVALMRKLLSVHQADDEAAMFLHLALARKLEGLAEYQPAFEHLAEGKRRGRLGRRYSFERDRQLFDALMEMPLPPQDEVAGDPSVAPVFVMGMPRSGTTLVERILSCHPQVHSAGELENFPLMVKRASGSATPALTDTDTLHRSCRLDWAQLGREYIEGTRTLTGGKPRFVDKLPHNFLYAGHIARALPNASIVCLRRGAMDTCLGNFRQLFSLASPYYDYSFDLLDTGRYYLLFDRLMRHWERTMPGRILQIDYEDLVDNQEAVTRRLLAHCGLSWDEACLRFQDNASPVSTASAVQVRSPMFRSSLQRWKRYEAQLGPLRALLEAGGIKIDA